MDYFEIHGLKTLNGVIEVSGAKNAVLPLMAASILNQGKENAIAVAEPVLQKTKEIIGFLS